jgi:glycosyltransferase involved in cell wall biosynthesis
MLGRPVVLSDIPAHREILEAAGPDVGAIFSWTASSFAAALREIERQDYGELSKRCEDSARLSLSASEMARQYQVVYEALVSGSIDDLATEVVTLDADPQRLRGLG